MGPSVSRLQNTIDGVAQDIGATMATITNTISNLQHDASGTVANVANECIESLRIIAQQTERTTYLLTNGLLAMMTAIVLSIFLYLTHFSPFLRAIVWVMYASLWLHMLMTYVRHSRSRTLTIPQHGQAALQYRNQELEATIAKSKTPSGIVLLHYKLNDEGMKIVISETINNQQYTTLTLINNQITASGTSILANALFNNKTLKRLSLWNNQVRDKGVQSLSNALSVNECSLIKLDLSQNDITDEGAGYLAQMLKTNKVLTHLLLSNNKISDKGVQSLSNALSVNECSLIKLDLSQNDITDEGAGYLAQMLKTNKVLTHLLLSDNKISDNGVQFLTDALQNRNNTLEVLLLTGNKSLTDASVGFLVNMFQHNRSLKELWVNDCNFSKNGQDILKRAARKDFKLHTVKPLLLNTPPL